MGATAMIEGLTLTTRPAALLLDAGDTLIFFDADALAELLATHGVHAEPARLQGAMHDAKQRYQAFLRAGGAHDDGWFVVVRNALLGAGVGATRAESLLPAIRRAHDDFNFWRRVPDGLLAALDRARAAGILLGVISNSEGRLRQALDHVDLSPRMHVILDSALEGVHKPNPEIFQRALTRLGVAPERALYAGDIPDVDLAGAAAAGMPGVLIDPHGYYADQGLPRVETVVELCDALLALPA
jgi:FMN phosphatase YigB (HAD superfamily)